MNCTATQNFYVCQLQAGHTCRHREGDYTWIDKAVLGARARLKTGAKDGAGLDAQIACGLVDLEKVPAAGSKHGCRWGNWILNLIPANNPSLDYIGNGYRNNPYWIPLSDLQTWQGFNYWMQHLNEKDWGEASMGDFVKAVMSIVKFPHAKKDLK